MKNKFLIKAKSDFDNGNDWEYGYYFCYESQYTEIPVKHLVMSMDSVGDHPQGVITHCEINPNTICRCAGFKDVNGELIYENDLLIASLPKVKQKVTYTIKQKGCSMCFVTKLNSTGSEEVLNNVDQHYIDLLKLKIVGNIYDNSELATDAAMNLKEFMEC